LDHTQVTVIGGGIAGLNAARRLYRAGVSFQLFEARYRIGGRVLTMDDRGLSTDGYDLGPSWFWPRVQPAIRDLVAELGLASFTQRGEGAVVFERMSREPAQRYVSVGQASGSMRFTGGAGTLARSLAEDLPPGTVHLNARVTALRLREDGVRIDYRDEALSERSISSQYVVVAMPPRLLGATIQLSPEPARETLELWRSTPTWMAAQAKFFALYDSPFWLEAGLSGTAQSMVGPLLEIHDATTASGGAALFGFLGVGPAERRAIGDQALTDACLAQLERIFGPEARTPTSTLLKDWAADPLTATGDDLISGGHPTPATAWVHGPWADRLVLAGSEVSPSEAGYLAGAVEASTIAAADVCRRLGQRGAGA
jgi:monoamine oxidase